MENPLETVRKRLGLPSFLSQEVFKFSNAKKALDIRSILEFNMYWEAKAIEGYLLHADRVLDMGDSKTASLLAHIRNEEEQHLEELSQRWDEITS